MTNRSQWFCWLTRYFRKLLFEEHTVTTFLQCDLAKEGFARNAAQMDKYCEEHGFAGWYVCSTSFLSYSTNLHMKKREETSAKDNINIDKAARLLVSKILERTKGEIPDTPDGEGKFKVTDDGGGKKGSEGGCCG